MAELRWHPLTKDWVMIASNRQNRPNMPKDYCPFCPSFGNVPDYEVLKYDNDFPALSQNPPEPDDVADDFFSSAPFLWQMRSDFIFSRPYGHAP